MLNTIRFCRLNKILHPFNNSAVRQINNCSMKCSIRALSLTTKLLNQNLIPQTRNFDSHTYLQHYSTNIQESGTLDSLTFENICEETLDGLTEYFEELVELDDSMKEVDIGYSSGVLTVNLGPSCTYVINKQSPNKQIWLSSPTSGPKRFDFNTEGKYWVYKHTGETLHQILQAEMPKIFKLKDIDFSKCCYSKL